MTRRPELIVPIRDRRQHRRIVTLKNFAIAGGAVVLVLVAITIESNLRRGGSGDTYGRLFGQQVAKRNDDLTTRKVDVIREAPVTDQNAPDPMLVAPAAREQLLLDQKAQQTPVTSTTIVPVATPAVAPTFNAHGDGGIAIVGGTDGVTVVNGQSTTTHGPVLSGGVFKQH